MTTWFTSDTHFGHERICELSNRPFASVEAMNEALVENWNAVVAPEDRVFHLGDVAMGKIADSLPVISRLNGSKILVLGNHDRPFIEDQSRRSAERKGNGAKRDKFLTRQYEWTATYLEVFDKITFGNHIVLKDRKVNLSHFPYDGDSYDGDRFTEARLKDEGRPLIHGHTHSTQKVTHSKAGTLQIHVGVDAWGYAPVSEETIGTLIEGYHHMWEYPTPVEAEA